MGGFKMIHLWHRWKKETTRRLTIMVIPHGIARPRQFSLSLPFLLFLGFTWTGFTGWAGLVAAGHFDYWRACAGNRFLKLKVEYFQKQLNSSRETLDEVKSLESELRSLLKLGSREAIVQTDAPLPSVEKTAGSGGPTEQDATRLERVLEGKTADIGMAEIAREIRALREEAEIRLAQAKELSQTIAKERTLFKATPNIWPANGSLTSPFGWRASPFGGYRELHRGLDIAGATGTPIRATADGTVTLAGWESGYGKLVVIDHGLGYSTRYGHNRQLLVQPGDVVKRGQIIGLMGETGRATGVHCHYEVWLNGRPINPSQFLVKQAS